MCVARRLSDCRTGPGFAVLLLGRVIQAVGAGVILPVMMSAALLIFPVYQRGMVMGMVGIAITLAPALGPTISGFIITLFQLACHFLAQCAGLCRHHFTCP